MYRSLTVTSRTKNLDFGGLWLGQTLDLKGCDPQVHRELPEVQPQRFFVCGLTAFGCEIPKC